MKTLTSLVALVTLLLSACGGTIVGGTTSTTGAASSTTGSAVTTTTTSGSAGSTTGTPGSTGTAGSGSAGSGSAGSGSAGSGSTTGEGVTGGTTGSGTATTGSCPYPGTLSDWSATRGHIFPNLPLSGPAAGLPLANPVAVDSTNPATYQKSISFQDFHQLSTACGGTLRYMFLDISSAWCINCKNEANGPLKENVAGWFAKGGVIFSTLVQSTDEQAPTPALVSDLTDWIGTYQVEYPMALDQGSLLPTATGLNAWPTNFLIDLRSMKVIDSVFGNDPRIINEFGGILDSCQTTADCYGTTTCSTTTYTCQ